MTHSITRDLYYSYFPNASKYLTFSTGDTNILLSAPHGGGIKPRNIPSRRYGNRSQDTYTRRVIQRIINGFGQNLYYVYADIHRSKVDLNRDKIEGAQGNKEMEAVWKNWNNLLSYYTGSISYRYKRGLYVDIHSHNKSDLFEIGYGLTSNDYLALKHGLPAKKESTMQPLVTKDISESELLFGDCSFVASLERFKFKVLTPKSDNSYLNGGRNITTYSGFGVGAIQIECPISVLKKELDKVSYTIANAIYVFQEKYLNVTPVYHEIGGES